jgi:hypothetical protein
MKTNSVDNIEGMDEFLHAYTDLGNVVSQRVDSIKAREMETLSSAGNVLTRTNVQAIHCFHIFLQYFGRIDLVSSRSDLVLLCSKEKTGGSALVYYACRWSRFGSVLGGPHARWASRVSSCVSRWCSRAAGRP